MLNILSLGAGVQSSTLALMLAEGEIKPMPDCAIFCDTGAEPRYVYDWLDWLEKQLLYPIYRVMKDKGLEANIINAIESNTFAGVPFFTESTKETESTICSVCQGNKSKCEWCDGKGFVETYIEKSGGMLRRQCTNEFKLQPLAKKIRELLGLKKGERAKKGVQVIQSIGISVDEAHRMKQSDKHYIKNIYPLVDAGLSRQDCLDWMNKKGYPKPAKSACYFCPYHSTDIWRELKEHHTDDFNKAVELDESIRKGVRGSVQKVFLHSSMKPLKEINFKEKLDGKNKTNDMFGDECEGMCGL